MNNLIKEKIRMVREEVKTFELKKESLKDKAEMQENFIKELEEQGKNNIQEKNKKIKVLGIEVDTHLEHNQLTEANVSDLMKEQEKVTGVDDKLTKLNNLKGKITQKVTTINIAIEAVKKTISTSVDKSKLDILFEKNLEETKIELKKVNS